MVQAPGLKQDTMLTHIIFEIHVNSKIQQKLHDSHMSSWTSPVQSSPVVLHQTWKQPLNQYRLQSSIMLTLCVCVCVCAALPTYLICFRHLWAVRQHAFFQFFKLPSISQITDFYIWYSSLHLNSFRERQNDNSIQMVPPQTTSCNSIG